MSGDERKLDGQELLQAARAVEEEVARTLEAMLAPHRDGAEALAVARDAYQFACIRRDAMLETLAELRELGLVPEVEAVKK